MQLSLFGQALISSKLFSVKSRLANSHIVREVICMATEPGPTSRKLRVLCLHGYLQNAEVLQPTNISCNTVYR